MNSMIHWQGDQSCVIDTETTGLDPSFHEILQICILPLDSNLSPRKDILPFSIEMKPEHLDRIDMEAISVSNLDLHNICLRGFDKEKAKDMLVHWMGKLGLPMKRNKTPCKIRPIGFNYTFDRFFMLSWLGHDLYNELFDHKYVDPMIVASYLNDRAAMHNQPIPFESLRLSSIATKLSVEHYQKHTALGDCVCTAEVYRRMVNLGLFG